MPAPKRDVERLGRRLKLRDLRILMTVVECGTMGKAAQKLAVSQPVVSKAISDMEHALGVRLLDRSQNGVEPTAYGRALIKRGVAIFDEMQQGLKDIESLSDPGGGEVRIGATNLIADAMALPVIDRLNRQHPRMRFHVVVADTAPLFSALEMRAVDLIMTRLARPIAAEQSAEILFHDALVVATGADNPLTRRRRLALADLINEPWVLSPGDSFFGALVAGAFRTAGLEPPQPTVSTSSVIVRNGLLATQRFLTVVTGFSLLLPRRRTDLVALPVKLPDTRQPVGIVTLKNRSLNPAVQMFVEHVRELTKPLAKNAQAPGRAKPGRP
jgi:DNA-binding transcriptional LysR family regulator